jgi:acyl-[acyl-carrier-protein]-phospholipid O-acyltransferase/long-chain-fatty-acid--[acyl-carrier-protein] ligase
VGGEGAGAQVALAGAVFIAPFFLLSGLAGELADRFDKALLARRLKGAEIGVAAVAALGFVLPSVPLLFVALAGFGTVSALFGPVKYAILPDHLPRERLTAANALVEFATFAAILGGTIAGGLAVGGAAPSWLVGGAIVLFALLSWGAARLIPPTGEAAPDLPVRRNILASTADLVRELRADGRVWSASLITVWFWLAGSVALTLLPPLVKDVLGGTEAAAALALCAFSVGIGLGSALAAGVAGARIILLPSVVGAALMGAALLDLWWTTRGLAALAPAADLSAFLARPGALRSLFDLAAVAVAGGLVVVPAFAAVQAWSGAERRARAVAGVNVLSSGAMAGGALLLALAQGSGFSAPALLGLLGAASLAVAAVMLAALPTNPMRDLLWMLFRVLYRLEVRGAEHLAAAGPRSVVALNHVSWLDAALALALLEREPVFAIDARVAQRWWVRPALRMFRALPLDPTKPFATRTLIEAVRRGETLVIFPEGRLTLTGGMMKVYDGAALVADKADAPVFPVRIEGLEASPFSRLRPGQVRRRLFPKLVVTALEPSRHSLDPALLGRKRREAGGAALQGLMSDLIWRTTPIERTVFEAVADAAARHGRGRTAVEDPLSGRLSYRRLLAGAAVLGRKLAPVAAEGEAVGILLPTANAAAATVLGLVSAGRVPAMLNFTAGTANLRTACAAAKVRTVVTSRRFLEQAKIGALAEELGRDVRVLYLEDVGTGISALDRPARPAARRPPPRAGGGPDDPAVILFTSGSEGTPKGVVLSHRNLLANAAQAAARIDFGREDKVFNALPVFHSFGSRRGWCLPLVSGVPTVPLPVAAALPRGAGADLRLQRHHPVRHGHLPRRLRAHRPRLRPALRALRAGRRRAGEAFDARGPGWRSSASACWRATA